MDPQNPQGAQQNRQRPVYDPSQGGHYSKSNARRRINMEPLPLDRVFRWLTLFVTRRRMCCCTSSLDPSSIRDRARTSPSLAIAPIPCADSSSFYSLHPRVSRPRSSTPDLGPMYVAYLLLARAKLTT